ncbi:MAG: GNAT family N-acetyltransferase, partial [Chloroflexota bacterium]
GIGGVSFDNRMWNDSVIPHAYFHSLAVDPKYRRQGVATRLSNWLYDEAVESIGEDAVMSALIQGGNIGSVKNVHRRASQFFEKRALIFPTKSLNKPPRQNSELSVREITSEDLEQVVLHQNNFYQDYNLYPVESEQSLSQTLQFSPFGSRQNSYFVVVDKSDNLLAGAMLADRQGLARGEIKRMPFPLKVVNKALRLFPASNIIANISVNQLWFKDGHIAAARYLVEMLRWKYRDRASNLTLWVDRLSPAKRIYGSRVFMLKVKGHLAIKAKDSTAEDRLIFIR